MTKITIAVFEQMARQTDDLFIYTLIVARTGFEAKSDKDKQDILEAWNKHHPDKRLPLPR